VLENAIVAFLDSVTEREFDEPLRALLRAEGFFDIHFVHGASEYGRDFIAKRDENGRRLQYSLQSKAGDLGVSAWRDARNQLEDIRTGDLAHPSFDPRLRRCVRLVTTGRIIGDAKIESQNYRERYRDEIDFAVWDQDDLVSMLTASPDAVLAYRDEAALLRILGEIGQNEVDEGKLEQFSRRWIAAVEERPDPVVVIEAGLLANRLRRQERLDLACMISLALLRAGCWGVHHREDDDFDISDDARRMFRAYASELFERCTAQHLRPVPFVNFHSEFGFWVTYSVRCARLVEILGLFALSGPVDEEENARVAEYVRQFIASQPGVAHPLSDKWATSLIPAALLLGRGHPRDLARLLREVTRWIANHYDDDEPGLATVTSMPSEEIDYLMSIFEHVTVRPRRESYLATVILDLASVCELSQTYDEARNEFAAVDALPEIVHTVDTADQYLRDGRDLQAEINIPYVDEWEQAEGWMTAPHHHVTADTFFLHRAGRTWDLIALQSVLRDRHFVGAMRAVAAA
jgi:hypothetical protein